LQQISDTVFCDDFVLNIPLATRLMPSPYETLPYLIIEDFFDPIQSRIIMSEVHQSLPKTQQHAEIKVSEQGAFIAKTNRNIRKTLTVELSSTVLEHYYHTFASHQERIEHFFNAPLSTASFPQGLYYDTGGFYECHADDSSMLLDSKSNIIGFKQVAPQRKITTIAFCNSHHAYDKEDGFEGGEVLFNFLHDAHGETIALRPKAGMLLVFPSNPIYAHEVKKVLQGERFCIVQWHNAVIA
jgi:SM-20-related protein